MDDHICRWPDGLYFIGPITVIKKKYNIGYVKIIKINSLFCQPAQVFYYSCHPELHKLALQCQDKKEVKQFRTRHNICDWKGYHDLYFQSIYLGRFYVLDFWAFFTKDVNSIYYFLLICRMLDKSKNKKVIADHFRNTVWHFFLKSIK